MAQCNKRVYVVIDIAIATLMLLDFKASDLQIVGFIGVTTNNGDSKNNYPLAITHNYAIVDGIASGCWGVIILCT